MLSCSPTTASASRRSTCPTWFGAVLPHRQRAFAQDGRHGARPVDRPQRRRAPRRTDRSAQRPRRGPRIPLHPAQAPRRFSQCGLMRRHRPYLTGDRDGVPEDDDPGRIVSETSLSDPGAGQSDRPKASVCSTGRRPDADGLLDQPAKGVSHSRSTAVHRLSYRRTQTSARSSRPGVALLLTSSSNSLSRSRLLSVTARMHSAQYRR